MLKPGMLLGLLALAIRCRRRYDEAIIGLTEYGDFGQAKFTLIKRI